MISVWSAGWRCWVPRDLGAGSRLRPSRPLPPVDDIPVPFEQLGVGTVPLVSRQQDALTIERVVGPAVLANLEAGLLVADPQVAKAIEEHVRQLMASGELVEA